MMRTIARGHVFETKAILIDNIHRATAIICPMTKKLLKASLPSNAISSQQFGDTVKAKIVYLWSVGVVTIDRIRQIMKKIFNIPVSAGTVMQVITDFAEKCKKITPQITQYLISSDTRGADETGLRANGSLH